MKNLTKALVLSLAAVMALGCMTACSGNSGSDTAAESSTAAESTADNSTTENSSADDTSAENSAADESSTASVDIAAADYSNPAVTIEFGDFETIKQVTEDMQSGKYDGQVIKVTGISQKRMTNCTIIERDESTGTGYGMTYYLEGQPELSEYPAEDAKVEICGVVTIGEYDVRALTVPADKVTVIENVAE